MLSKTREFLEDDSHGKVDNNACSNNTGTLMTEYRHIALLCSFWDHSVLNLRSNAPIHHICSSSIAI